MSPRVDTTPPFSVVVVDIGYNETAVAVSTGTVGGVQRLRAAVPDIDHTAVVGTGVYTCGRVVRIGISEALGGHNYSVLFMTIGGAI